MHVGLALGLSLSAGPVGPVGPVGWTGGQQHSSPIQLSNGTGSVRVDLAMAPDGNRVLYRDRLVAGGPWVLLVAPIDGSSVPRRLSPPPVTGGNVVEFRIDPAGTHVVYRADQDVDDTYELYGMLLDGGGPPVKLNGVLAAGGNVQPGTSSGPSFQISPDGAWVVYRADQDADEVVELYSVTIDRSVGPTKLNSPLPPGGDVLAHAIDPASERAVYRADQDVDGVQELYSAPIDGGGAPVRLNDPLPAGRNVRGFQITPEGSRVVYTADPYILRVNELFSVEVDGSGSPTRVNYPLASGELVTAFAMGPDGRRVAFSERRTPPAAGSGAVWTGSGSVAGGGLGLLAYWVVDDTTSMAISPDGERVVWDRGNPLGGSHVLLSGPCRKGRLSAEVVQIASLGYGGKVLYEITPDSRTVVYANYASSGGDLMSVPIDGSLAPVRITASSSSSGFTSDFEIASDGVTVVYVAAHEDGYGTTMLYRTRVDGSGPPQRISGPIARYGEVAGFQLGTDDLCAAFSADRQATGAYELYATCVLELHGLAPGSGPFAGGTRIVLEGFGFTPAAAVAFDGRPASSVVRLDGSTLVAIAPAFPVPPRSGRRALVRRTVDVVVTDGTASARLAGAYTYTHR